MSFPTSPTNGQQATVNGIVYNYNSTKGAWIKNVTTAGTLTSGNLVLTSNTASTNTTTGALIVTGGVGISRTLYIANTGDVSANIGAFQTYANTKIGTNTDSNLVVVATTTSTSTTTGALVVRGGVGIAGNVILSGNLQTGSRAITRDSMPVGSIIQTQYVASTTRTTLDSTSFAEPSVNYRVNITPTSTNSLMKISYSIPMNPGASYQANTIFSIRAFRLVNSVKSYALTSAGTANGNRTGMAGVTFRPNNGFDLNDPSTQHFFVFDAPGTTSQVTYGFEFRRESGGTGNMYFGYTASDSSIFGFDTNITIIVEEIAQ